MKKILLLLFIIFLAAAVPVFILSCGSGSGGAGGGFANDNSSPGSVALYVTDIPETDSPKDVYKQASVTINSVRLEHIGSGLTCDVLTTPVTLDITDLASILQLLNVGTCPSSNFNRIHIEFDKRIVLTDNGNTTAECHFTKYREGDNNPNVLICPGNTCSINISGAVNVISEQTNELALDFDLNDFEVNDFNQQFCSVTMKASPLSASDFDARQDEGDKEGISGFISDLDTIANSFTLTSEGGTFTVTYADIIAQGIDNLLTLAAADQLMVKVESSIIDLNSHKIEATALYVEIDGTASGLNTVAQTFTLTYKTNKTISVVYQSDGVVETLLSGSDVEVKLNGYDGSKYIATEVELNN